MPRSTSGRGYNGCPQWPLALDLAGNGVGYLFIEEYCAIFAAKKCTCCECIVYRVGSKSSSCT